MVNVNFSPWRLAELNYRKKILKKMLLAAILFPLMIVFITHAVLSRRDALLQKQMNMLNEKLNAMTQMNVANAAGKNSSSLKMVKLLNEFSAMNHKKACLTTIERNELSFLIEGRTRSMTDLSHFIFTGRLFSDIQLKLIEQDKNGMLRFGFEAKRDN